MYIRRVNEGDKDLVKEWLNSIEWNGFDAAFMPSTSFMVYDGDTPICCSYYYCIDEVSIALMGITIANPDYKENKSEYIQHLLKYIINDMKEKNLRVCYYSTYAQSEKFVKKYMEPLGFQFSQGFVGACSLTLTDKVEFLV